MLQHSLFLQEWYQNIVNQNMFIQIWITTPQIHVIWWRITKKLNKLLIQKIIVAVFVSAVELAQFFMMGTFLIVTFFIDADAFFFSCTKELFYHHI